jgi:microcystin-dependent protein
MATGVASWSQTAATNASVDATINFAEGMAPAAYNDSARALMASVAKYRDDVGGTITTGGTSTAYTVTSNQGFASLSALSNQVIAFVPHISNLPTVTLAVDGLTAKPVRTAPGCELPAGTLIAGTPYIVTYNNSDTVYYLHAAGGVPGVPVGTVLPYSGSTAPSSHYVFSYGQAISRSTYAGYFNVVGTTHGVGNGSTTFNVPDLRGRAIFGKEDMGGVSAGIIGSGASGYGSLNGVTLGSAGGEALHTITAAESAGLTYTTTSTDAGHTHTTTLKTNNLGLGGAGTSRLYLFDPANADGSIDSITSDVGHASISSSTTSNAGGGSHNNMPPAIILTYILRVL